MIIVVRHGETVYNHAGRMQGHEMHTPLTRRGIEQAREMASAIRMHTLQQPWDIWSSPSGRALQTAAIIAEELDVDFFSIRTDQRLHEIDVGDWSGRTYKEVVAEIGAIHSPEHGLFSVPPPGGEWFPEIEGRLRQWLVSIPSGARLIVVTHGVTARVLRGLLSDGLAYEGTRVGSNLPQGSVALIDDAGAETILMRGSGREGLRSAV